MPFLVATNVYASSQGQRTHSARTKINVCAVLHETRPQTCPERKNKILACNYHSGLFPNLIKPCLPIKRYLKNEGGKWQTLRQNIHIWHKIFQSVKELFIFYITKWKWVIWILSIWNARNKWTVGWQWFKKKSLP